VSVLERKLVRDAGARRWQFGAIGVTVTLGVMLFAASFDAYRNLQASYDALFDRTHFAALTIEGGDPTEVRDAVEAVDGVDGVAVRRVADVPFRVGARTLVGRLVGMPAGRPPAVNDVLMLRGERLDAAAEDGVIVERHLVEAFELDPGDRFEVRLPGGWREVRVLGVAASPEYVWPARSRQQVFTLPDQFGVAFVPAGLLDPVPAPVATSQVLVTTRGPADDAAVLDRLTAAALDAGASSTFTRAEQPSNATLAEDIQGFGELAVLFPLLFLTAAAIATSVLLGRMVLAQRRLIGLLLAVGFERRRVFAHYLAFGLVIGLSGAVAGTAAGMLLAGVITEVYTGVIGIPISIVEIRPTTALMGVAFGVVAGSLAAVLPAWRAARISPAAAMAGAAGSGHGGTSLVERMVPPLRRMPARWRMVLRGIGRSRVRSLSTMVGVMLAVTLVLVSWAMIDTVDILVDRQFGEAEQQDATLVVPQGTSDQLVETALAVPGVAAAEPIARQSVTIARDGRRYATTLVVFESGTEMHRFLTGDGARELPPDGILVGRALEQLLDLAPGDRASVQADGAAGASEAVVAGFVDEPLGTLAYASRSVAANLLGPERLAAATAEIGVRLAPEADRGAVLDRLESVGGVAVVVDVRALQAAAESLMGLFYAFVAVMLVLGSVMAFAVLFNLMAANIGERVTELASLRAAGMSASELSRIITAENVLLTVAGIVPGLLVGWAAAAEFMASFSSDLFSFELHVRPTTFILTALAVLGASLVSQLPILRSVRRIDIARIVRERAS
jgi:putative ABC transport system permease protein